jgi:DNA polymerase I-like protein with 3'-5' exonuclease and polymerase domains
MMEFSYKVPNALIQGSAADCTKQAVIEWWRKKDPDEYLLFNVHDQVTCSVPKKKIKVAMEKLRVAMEGIQFDVPMLSEGSWSDKSWADLIDFDRKGKVLYGN